MLKTQSEAKQGKAPAERAELGGHSTSVVESSAWGAGGSPRQGVRAHWGKGDISRKNGSTRSVSGAGRERACSPEDDRKQAAGALGRAASNGLRTVPLGRTAKAAA